MEKLILYSVFLFGFSSATCGGKDGLVCCSGYIWNQQIKECLKCPPGRYGVNCTGVCIYPSYGELCSRMCTCEKDKCHRAKGCLNTKEYSNTSANNSIPIKQIKTMHDYSFDKYNKTKIQVPDCHKCNATFTPEEDHFQYLTFGHDAVQIGMFSTTVLLSLIFIFFLLTTIQSRCKRSKESKCNKDFGKENAEEHYHELDKHTELKGNFIFNGKADAKLAFDETQNRYYIELTALSPRFSEVKDLSECVKCSFKETSLRRKDKRIKPEISSETSYISPCHHHLEQMSCTDTQMVNENGDELVRCSGKDMYLSATSCELE
ncbi:uncharacterized protein LOC134237092 [Saccostrea cucullata]|uniref:uncharacterized protein LOC134237092 n=1 Tax=Saccostrea cuccullata TaxID=36930 RepID=UPI002ED0F502